MGNVLGKRSQPGERGTVKTTDFFMERWIGKVGIGDKELRVPVLGK